MKGRKVEHGEPALLYDFRRGKHFVDLIASATSDSDLRQRLQHLCDLWGVLPHPTVEGNLIALAQHVKEHYREGQK